MLLCKIYASSRTMFTKVYNPCVFLFLVICRPRSVGADTDEARCRRRSWRALITSNWAAISTGRSWCPEGFGSTLMNRSPCSWRRTRTLQTATEHICLPACVWKGVYPPWNTTWTGSQGGKNTHRDIKPSPWSRVISFSAYLFCPTRRWTSGATCWASCCSSCWG